MTLKRFSPLRWNLWTLSLSRLEKSHSNTLRAVIVFSYLHTYKWSILVQWIRGLAFISILDDKAALRLCSCPRLCLFWTSPLSHVKQWFVHSNGTPTVMITFAVCHTDPPWCCLFWLYRDNGCFLCLIRVPGSGSTPFFFARFFLSVSLLLDAPSLFLHPAVEEVMRTLTQLSSSHPITAETKRVLFHGPRYVAPQREREERRGTKELERGRERDRRVILDSHKACSGKEEAVCFFSFLGWGIIYISQPQVHIPRGERCRKLTNLKR